MNWAQTLGRKPCTPTLFRGTGVWRPPATVPHIPLGKTCWAQALRPYIIPRYGRMAYAHHRFPHPNGQNLLGANLAPLHHSAVRAYGVRPPPSPTSRWAKPVRRKPCAPTSFRGTGVWRPPATVSHIPMDKTC